MQAALSKVDGVKKVDVDYANKLAHVSVDGKADTGAMIAALEAAGYGASVTAE